MTFPIKMKQTIIVLVFLTLSFPSWSNNFEKVYDETGLLTTSEKEEVERQLASLRLSHIHLADDFEGLRPIDFAYNTFKEVFYNRTPIGNEGFVIVYSAVDMVFEIYTGTKWTYAIEETEKLMIINEVLLPAFVSGNAAEGLLEAIVKVNEIFIENNTYPISEELVNQNLTLVDESGLLDTSLSEEIKEYLASRNVTDEEHIIYVRSSSFKGEDFDPHYSPYHGEGASVLDDINYVYAKQVYDKLFKDRRNRFQVGNREKPDLTLLFIFDDEFYLLTNWEQFLDVQLGGDDHVRTLTDYLGWMYDDYIGVGSEEAGIKRIVKIVVELSRNEIEPLRGELKPPFFSLAWLNNRLVLMLVIFGAIVLMLIAIMSVSAIRKRNR